MKIALEPDKYYHIFNHANGKEDLFVNDGNCHFFLKRYSNFIDPIADTFAYCLMPNHFHFAIRIKSEEEIERRQLLKSSKLLGNSKYISKQFSNLFSSYTQAFNKQQNRMGSLFIPSFKRKCIDSDSYFSKIIHYIHYNPVHHGFVKEIRDWKYSSLETFYSQKPSKIKRAEVIEWFGGEDGFWKFHQEEVDKNMINDLEG